MSKAFLTDDTPSLFDNVCQVSNTAEVKNKISKSDYLELKKSLKEAFYVHYDLDVFYYAREYNEDAKAEVNKMYDFLKNHFKNFKIIYENMRSDGIARKGIHYPSRGAKIASFIEYIYYFYFYKFLSLDLKMNTDKLRDFYEDEKKELETQLYKKFDNFHQVTRRLETSGLDYFLYRQLYHLTSFNYYDNIFRFYKNNQREIDDFIKDKFKGYFERRYKKRKENPYDDTYHYKVEEFLMDCFKDFVSFLNNDRDKMKEFLKLLRVLKEKTYFINLKRRNDFMTSGNDFKGSTFKAYFFKRLKKNSKAIRDFLKDKKIRKVA